MLKELWGEKPTGGAECDQAAEESEFGLKVCESDEGFNVDVLDAFDGFSSGEFEHSWSIGVIDVEEVLIVGIFGLFFLCWIGWLVGLDGGDEGALEFWMVFFDCQGEGCVAPSDEPSVPEEVGEDPEGAGCDHHEHRDTNEFGGFVCAEACG
jgi:hypothetical protein